MKRQEAESRVFISQLMPISDNFSNFNLSSCPQLSLNVKSTWYNTMCLLQNVPNCEQNFSFLMFDPDYTASGMHKDYRGFAIYIKNHYSLLLLLLLL
jgi:hypothetical protein